MVLSVSEYMSEAIKVVFFGRLAGIRKKRQESDRSRGQFRWRIVLDVVDVSMFERDGVEYEQQEQERWTFNVLLVEHGKDLKEDVRLVELSEDIEIRGQSLFKRIA
jgi:hypothetical protein